MIKLEKYIRHIVKFIKFIVYPFVFKSNKKAIFFILGYGRSGTSILINIFSHYFFVDPHEEKSKHFMEKYQINYKKFDNYLKKTKHKNIFLKPILNSCDVNFIIENYENSKILWVFRDYKDVIFSSMKKFDKRVANEMKSFIKNNISQGWISNQMHFEEKEILMKLENNNFSDLDWMALVWWFVNHTLYRQQLHNNPNIFLLQYKDLVTKPKEFYYNFSSFSGLCFRNAHVYIDSLNLGKGKNISLSKEVDVLCKLLFDNLKNVKTQF